MRYLFLLLVAFAMGFLVRDYTGPVKLPVSFRTISDAAQPKSKDTVPGNVEIVYDNGKFSPAEAVIATGRWLSITNKSNALMWIESDNPYLSTVRGYGL
jgi:hypothetical protein